MWTHENAFYETERKASGWRETCEQHVEQGGLGLEADGGAEEVEGGRELLHRQVHQAQVVEDLPVERRQVHRTLQTADSLGTSSHGMDQWMNK